MAVKIDKRALLVAGLIGLVVAAGPVAADVLVVCPAGDNMLIPDPSINCTTYLDIDGGGQVGLSDFVLFAATFNLSPNDPNFNPAADFNCDGIVSVQDFTLFGAHWQHH